MYRTSEKGMSFWGAITFLGVVAILSIYVIHLCQKAVNESRADTILNGATELAEYERDRIEEESMAEEPEHSQPGSIERKGYGFAVVDGSVVTLVKIETQKRTIPKGVCTILKKKLKRSMWRDVFQKVVVVDKMGAEKTDILVYDCPRDTIPALRFYVKFDGEAEEETEEDKKARKQRKKDAEEVVQPESAAPGTYVAGEPVRPSRVSVPTYTRNTACPAGTSRSGKGGIAAAGCRCTLATAFWNGKTCQEGCPPGSSRGESDTGDETDVGGCYCNPKTPVWTGKQCVKQCSGNRIFDPEKGSCVCMENMVLKSDSLNVCVECNRTSDCASGYKCVSNKCIGDDREYDDCRWGICQMCDSAGSRSNIPDAVECEVAGLNGKCNGNGTCYPTNGRRCNAVKRCSSGEFCNYGGTFNSSKRQRGKFGQTPNVCQVVSPLEFTYGNVTYYYNSKKDLKSWCRAANNKPNCKWGYLAKPGAESWCASLGKRLLTRSEMESMWDVLRKHLPKTYTGYAYWVQEGVWLENKHGKRGFSKSNSDGYGGKGGVVCM